MTPEKNEPTGVPQRGFSVSQMRIAIVPPEIAANCLHKAGYSEETPPG